MNFKGLKAREESYKRNFPETQLIARSTKKTSENSTDQSITGPGRTKVQAFRVTVTLAEWSQY